MSFYIIRNNDLATADTIMSNFRHVNYGNPLIAVNALGTPVDRVLDLGSSPCRWKDIYGESLNITKHIKIHNSIFGNMYYADSSGILLPIPLGDSGDVLTSTGKNTAPEWKEIENRNIKTVFDTGYLTISRANAYYKFQLPPEIDVFNIFPLFFAFSAASGNTEKELDGITTDKLYKVFLSCSFQTEVPDGKERFGKQYFPFSLDGIIWSIQEDNMFILRKRSTLCKFGYVFADKNPRVNDYLEGDSDALLVSGLKTIDSGILRCVLLQI